MAPPAPSRRAACMRLGHSLMRRRRALGAPHRVAAVLIGVAFAVLVSVAATHLHIGPDADEGCAVCAAVIGKLEGPSAPPLALAACPCAYAAPQIQVAQRPAAAALVVLPPSCGPPHFA
jgi:hypothetical protein